MHSIFRRCGALLALTATLACAGALAAPADDWPNKPPDGHFKFPHLWPFKLPRAGRANYESVSALSAMREAASLRR
jgi:hypothetical protein